MTKFKHRENVIVSLPYELKISALTKTGSFRVETIRGQRISYHYMSKMMDQMDRR